MKVFGLYGRSGTGKSHTAQIFANKLGVYAIIDDGILIVNQDHIAGVSAKCEAFLHADQESYIFIGRKLDWK